MRIPHVLLVCGLGLQLCGCLGVTLPPEPIPDWAMNTQADGRGDRSAALRHKKERIVRQHKPSDLTAVESALVTGSMLANTPVAPRVVEPKAFAPGWDAPEEERDASLRRTMSICRC